MEEIHKLRAQISGIVQTNFPESDAGFVANLLPPSALQVRLTQAPGNEGDRLTCIQLKVLRQLLAAGFIDQVAVRKDKVSKDGASGQQYTTSRGVPYRAIGIDEDVFIHPAHSTNLSRRQMVLDIYNKLPGLSSLLGFFWLWLKSSDMDRHFTSYACAFLVLHWYQVCVSSCDLI